MAKQIHAINAYRPRLDLGEAVTEARYMELVTSRTTLSAGVVKNVQETEIESLIGFLLDGRPVHTGAVIYRPTMRLDGRLAVSVRVDRRILRALNAEGAYRGRVRNADNIGKSGADLVALWNIEHPDDPIP